MKRKHSAIVHKVLRERQQRMDLKAREEQDRAGYLTKPESSEEVSIWEAEAAWSVE